MQASAILALGEIRCGPKTARCCSRAAALEAAPRRRCWGGIRRARGSILAILLAGSPLLPAQESPLAAPGITEPYYDGTLSASVAGTLAERLVREGEFVKKGQVIATLDKELEELTLNRRKLVRDVLKTELEGDRKLLETTRSVSREAVDKKEMEYRVAVVDYQTAEEQLRRRLIVAPVDGFVTEFYRDVGEDCDAQEPVVRLVDTRRCYFVANLEARLGYPLKVGQKLQLEVEAGAGTAKLGGEVTFVSPVVDPASGLMRIKVLFDNPDARIRPGVPGKILLEMPADGR